MPGENGDLNHGVVIDLILHWPSWCAGPQAPPRQNGSNSQQVKAAARMPIPRNDHMVVDSDTK
jgi:hypothetical protein